MTRKTGAILLAHEIEKTTQIKTWKRSAELDSAVSIHLAEKYFYKSFVFFCWRGWRSCIENKLDFNPQFVLIFNLLFIWKTMIKSFTQTFQGLNNFFENIYFIAPSSLCEKPFVVGKQSNSLDHTKYVQNSIYFLITRILYEQ